MALSGDGKLALGTAAASTLGGLFGGLAQGKQNDKDRKLTAQQALLQSVIQGNQADPYQQAKFNQQDMLRNALFSGGGSIGDVTSSFNPATGRGTSTGGISLGPNFMQQAAPAFDRGVTQGYATKFNDQFQGAQDALAQSAGMHNGQPIPDGYEVGKDGQLKKKSSLWGKIAKIGLAAAPIVAAPFTGGASLALIGAGAGAASGAMNGGGLRGALTGGAMGGLTAGITGGMAKNIPGLNQVGKFASKVPGISPVTGTTNAVNPSQYFKGLKF